MDLKKRFTRDITLSGVIFLFIIIFISGSFLMLNNSINSLIKESDPALDTMEHLLLAVYKDNIVLVDYMNVDSYESAEELDEEISVNDASCTQITQDIQLLLLQDKIRDPVLKKRF
jgi:hypothetical protein